MKCRNCGATITFNRSLRKWVTTKDKWRCSNDSAFPVRAHEPGTARGRLYVIYPNVAEPRRVNLFSPPTTQELMLQMGDDDVTFEQVPRFNYFVEPGTPDDSLSRCVAFCDEDGRRKALPVNDAATKMWSSAMGCVIPRSEWLVGIVIVVTGDETFMEEL